MVYLFFSVHLTSCLDQVLLGTQPSGFPLGIRPALCKRAFWEPWRLASFLGASDSVCPRAALLPSCEGKRGWPRLPGDTNVPLTG